MVGVPESSQVFRFGVFEADLQTRELRKNCIKLKVHDQPIQILGALLERRARSSHARNCVRGFGPPRLLSTSISINTSVNKLREVLGDSADSPRFIETLARRGYRFVAPVEVVVNGAVTNATQTPPPSSKRWNSEALAWSLFAVASLALALLSAVHFRQRQTYARAVRFQIALPDNVSLGSDDIPVLSPDGRGFVFRARSPDGAHLWIHSFD